MGRRSKRSAARGFGDTSTPPHSVLVTAGASLPHGTEIATEAQFLEDLSKQKMEQVRNAQSKPDLPPEPSAPVTSTSSSAVSVQSAPSSTPPEPEPEPEPEPAVVQLDQATLQGLISGAIQQAIAPYEARSQQQQQDHDSAIAQLQQQLNQANQQRDAMLSVFKLQGVPEPVANAAPRTPNFNPTTSPHDEPQGALREFMTLPRMMKTSRQGTRYISNSSEEIRRYVRSHRRELIQDLEAFAKAHGLLRGNQAVPASQADINAATTRADLPPAFLDTLSAVLRENNKPGLIFHQFINMRVEVDKNEGDTIQVPRAAFIPGPTTGSDRALSGGGTFVRIDSTGRNIQAGSRPIVITEWGLGKDSTSPPVEIPTFVQAHSMLDLMMILERNLLHDFNLWEDIQIRSLWDPTSRVVYNDNGAVTATLADLAAGDGGQITRQFLYALYGYMRSIQIPAYMDGCYGLAINSLSAVPLKKSLDELFNPATETELMALTNILNPTVIAPGEPDKITGYLGKYGNFHCFETNNFGCGAAGTPGAQTETIETTARLTRTSYAFGADTIARGVSDGFMITRDNNDDFGRLNRYIWRSFEGFAALDVDPTGYSDTTAVPQQLRVVEIHATDVAL